MATSSDYEFLIGGARVALGVTCQAPHGASTATLKGTVILAFDVSASMAAEDIEPSREE